MQALEGVHGHGDPLVGRCVLSVQAQLHGTMAHEMVRRLLPDLQDDSGLRGWIDHIAEFSLAGIQALARREQDAAATVGPLAAWGGRRPPAAGASRRRRLRCATAL